MHALFLHVCTVCIYVLNITYVRIQLPTYVCVYIQTCLFIVMQLLLFHPICYFLPMYVCMSVYMQATIDLKQSQVAPSGGKKSKQASASSSQIPHVAVCEHAVSCD